MNPLRVATISRPGLTYPETPPYGPPTPVYAAIEALFRELGLDAGRVGTPDWNPLGDLIAPGDRVVVKPNLVSSRNLHERILGEELQASSTHGSLLRPVLDYAWRAAGSRGRVRVVDAPLEGCELEKVAGPLGIFHVIEALRTAGRDVRFVDLRHFRVAPRFLIDDVRRLGRSWNLGMLIRHVLPGDPSGYRNVDLGPESFFAKCDPPPVARLRFHRSHYETPLAHHTAARHEYSMPQSVLDADVVINLPKLKTHKKTGITTALKGAIGLSNQKYWLPHFTAGDPSLGGDEYDRPQDWRESLESRLSRFPLPGDHSLVARAARLGAVPRVIDGSWEGNRTLWRTILDLNRILFFADREGRMASEPQRRYLAIVDGIVAGEGEGPLGATPVRAGLLIGGFHPALVDAVAAETIGFDPARIPTVQRALDGAPSPASAATEIERVWHGPAYTRRFTPPRSWPSLAPSRSA